MTGTRIARTALAGALALSLIGWAAPALAQTGQLRGTVVDEQKKPVRDAVVTIVAAATNRKHETKTNRRGEFQQIGLAPGTYTVSVQKGELSQVQEVQVGLDMKELAFELKPDGGADEKARAEEIKATFAEGAKLTNEGKHDEAIEKFNAVIALLPACAECHANLGSVYTRKQEWERAEASYRKAIELNPDLVDAYNGLANVYNAQRKFKEAQEMSAEGAKRSGAGGGAGNAEGLYNQGVIAWNANDFQKAQELFSAAVQADETHAESHFMLGQAYLNLGKLPEAAKEFETYTKIAPDGRNADKAKTFYESLKQYIK